MPGLGEQFVMMIGGGEVVFRLLTAARQSPLWRDDHVVVAAPEILPAVADIATICLDTDSSRFRHLLETCTAIYMGVPAGCSLRYLERLASVGPRDRLIIIEKPVCPYEQVPSFNSLCKEIPNANVRVDDHWLLCPALTALKQCLVEARRRFGQLYWINVALDETRLIAPNRISAFVPMRGVWGEYLFHAWSLLRGQFPGFTVGIENSRLLLTHYEGVPSNLDTFAAFAGLATGFGDLCDTRSAILTVRGGKGLHRDRKSFEFVYENGTVLYDHGRGQISAEAVSGVTTERVSCATDPFASVWSGLVRRDPGRFSGVQEALGVVSDMEKIRHDCLAESLGRSSPIRVPVSYPVGKCPLPDWPADGVATILRLPRVASWARHVGFRSRRAVARRLWNVMRT